MTDIHYHINVDVVAMSTRHLVDTLAVLDEWVSKNKETAGATGQQDEGPSAEPAVAMSAPFGCHYVLPDGKCCITYMEEDRVICHMPLPLDHGDARTAAEWLNSVWKRAWPDASGYLFSSADADTDGGKHIICHGRIGHISTQQRLLLPLSEYGAACAILWLNDLWDRARK